MPDEAASDTQEPPAPAADDDPASRAKDAHPVPAPAETRQPLAGRLASLFGSSDRFFAKPANQYLLALHATYLSLLSKRTDSADQQIWDELRRIFAKYPDGGRIADDEAAWSDAHRCERLLVEIYDPTRLDVELDRRILEAQNAKLDFASFYVGRQQKPVANQELTPDQLAANRSLLSRLIDDQQWHDTKLFLKRGYAHEAQKRVSMAFFIALLVFGGTMFQIFQTREFVGVGAVNTGSVNAEDGERPAAPAANEAPPQ